jgi:hypothetical protein
MRSARISECNKQQYILADTALFDNDMGSGVVARLILTS